MKKKNIIYILFLLFIAFVVISWTKKEETKKNLTKRQFTQQLIYTLIKQTHFKSIELNDTFSEQTLNYFLEQLDPDKLFFIKKDIDGFSAYKYEVDNEIEGNSTSKFYDVSTSIWKERVKMIENFTEEILSTPFDFNKKEWMETEKKKLDYAKNEAELKNKWKEKLKYTCLTRYASLMKANEKEKEKKTTAEIEKQIREEVLKIEKNYFKYLKNWDEDDFSARYFNAMLSSYDPHTLYFPPKEKEDFDILISGQLEGIGATLQLSESKIKVVSIVPGGAAWKQKELKEGNIILKVKQEEEELPVSVLNMSLKNAVQLIRGKKGTKVTLTVEEPDRTIKEITITRDVIILEESYLKLGTINTKDNKKYGYIYLPSFYFDMNGKGGRNCYEDVKEAVLLLKKENIQGMAIDIRYNGGGSLKSVIDITGLFVDEKPVVQVTDRNNVTKVLKTHTEKIYDGPLVVLVNKSSASASEIFAAALEDYQRAVIVGSKNTYGKGTVQKVIDIDNTISSQFKQNLSEFGSLGAIKFTSQKFYRINGKTTQLHGVIPDIILPDLFQDLEIGELYTKNPLPFDEIQPAEYTKKTNKDFSEVIENSKKRIDKNPLFKKINTYSKLANERRKKTLLPLDYTTYRAEKEKYENKIKKYKDISMEQEDWKLESLQLDKNSIYPDSVKTDILNKWAKKVEKDIHIYETINILNDLSLEKKIW